MNDRHFRLFSTIETVSAGVRGGTKNDVAEGLTIAVVASMSLWMLAIMLVRDVM